MGPETSLSRPDSLLATTYRDIIVIGGSAGGIEALLRVVANVPTQFPGSILVVVHLPAYARSELPAIITKAGTLPATHAQDGEPIKRGQIYIAPPDHHLIVARNGLLVRRGPRENWQRPAVDALFRSAAYVYENRVVGVILSGALDDGASGMWTIKHCGGTTIVQAPSDAEHPGMPESALKHADIDYVVPETK